MRKVLYRPSWQKLRVSFLAQNHPSGGFITTEGTNDNLRRLSNYINDAYKTGLPPDVIAECARMRITPEQEYACRIYRAINLLNATRMGYRGQGLKDTPMDKSVGEYRDQLQEVSNNHLVVMVEALWNWYVVRSELEYMWLHERFWFGKIYTDLARRSKVAGKRRSKTTGPQIDQTRPELLQFLRLMDDVNLH